MVASTGNHAHHSISIFLIISVILFIVSIAGAGFTFVWQKVLLNQQDQYKSDLAKDQNQFDTDLISTLTNANVKIDVAKSILNRHMDVSKIFGIISQLTIASVQWKNLSFSVPSSDSTGTYNNGGSNGGSVGDDITISMQGETDSYYSVAYQSDVFGKSSQLGSNAVIVDPVLSGLSVNGSGKVDFSFTAKVSPSELAYMSGSSSTNSGSSQIPASSTSSTSPTASTSMLTQ